jgi:hypothetical protein
MVRLTSVDGRRAKRSVRRSIRQEFLLILAVRESRSNFSADPEDSPPLAAPLFA